ncbi:hypothetical protein HDU76_010402, partial [Blyttiomyces sp. JEL0837]
MYLFNSQPSMTSASRSFDEEYLLKDKMKGVAGHTVALPDSLKGVYSQWAVSEFVGVERGAK